MYHHPGILECIMAIHIQVAGVLVMAIQTIIGITTIHHITDLITAPIILHIIILIDLITAITIITIIVLPIIITGIIEVIRYNMEEGILRQVIRIPDIGVPVLIVIAGCQTAVGQQMLYL
jgi:hypothetical protein